VVKLHGTLEDLSLYRVSIVEAKPKLYRCNICGKTSAPKLRKAECIWPTDMGAH